jgi:hypothetical protein
MFRAIPLTRVNRQNNMPTHHTLTEWEAFGPGVFLPL